MRRACCLQLRSQMFQLLLVSLVLQVYIVSSEELDPTTPDYEFDMDYTEFEVLFHEPHSEDDHYEYDGEPSPTDFGEPSPTDFPGNSASSISPSYFTIAALLLSYLICLVLHQDLHGSISVWQNRKT